MTGANDAVIFQAYWTDEYLPMVDAIKPRHQKYADKWCFDLQAVDLRDRFDSVSLEDVPCEVVGILNDLLKQYKFVVKLDPDTLIWDMDTDLRDATDNISAVRYQADKPIGTDNQFWGLNNHLNVGAVYIKRNAFTLRFMDDWYKLTCESAGWYGAQNSFNLLAIKHNLPELDAKWNHTRNRHGACDKPIVRGYHGYKGFSGKMNEIAKDLSIL